MGHKTLIDGVGYEITGGRCLVDGVGYSIQKGRTLIDGVGYDVAFGSPAISVTITGNGRASRVYVTVGGVDYISATDGLTVEQGDEIGFYINDIGKGRTVVIDGVEVARQGGNPGTEPYRWSVPGGITSITIQLIYTTAFSDAGFNVTTS